MAWYRVALALLGWSALVTELATLAERGALVLAHFFSYFTVLSNGVVALILLYAAVRGRTARSADLLRGAATTYMVLVLGVFSVLLAGLDVQLTAVPWDNVVLHYLVPVGVVADWLLDPPRRRISFGTGLAWLAFPAAYVGLSLVRGAATGWYPYPFLDPDHGGYPRVALTCLAITALVLVVVWLVTRRHRGRR